MRVRPSERHRNHELDRVNNDLTNLLASANIPVVMVGADHRIRRVTPPARRVMNVLPSDVGRPIGDVKLAAVTDDLEDIVARVVETVQPVEREVKDREGRWYTMRVHPYRTADNRIDGAVIVLIDIHERRRAEAALLLQSGRLQERTALIELSQDAIIVPDAADRVLTWNHGAQEMYGWTPAEAEGQKLDQLLGTDPDAWRIVTAELERTGAWEGELEQTRRDGRRVLVHSREVLVRDQRGARSAVLSIKRDVTELRAAVDALKRAGRRKDEFLATLAHELRNPLAPIRNAGEIIRRAGDDPAAVAKAREILDRQLRQLSRIVDDLIDLSRIVERKIELRMDRVPLGSVISTAAETCRSLVAARGQKLSITMPDEPLWLQGDPVRLAQIFINLLQNAARYSDTGSPIWLTAEHDSSDAAPAHHDGRLVVRVRDRGIGIAPEFLPHVFEAFSQAEPGGARNRGGMGVGLALVRSLVEMHGGSVDALSRGPGHGSEFIVRLPLADPAAPAAPEAPAVSTPAAARRVLVVDDNADQLQSLGMLLRLMGHEVRLAAAGQEAIDAAAEFRPDVALVDIGLPDIDGYGVARELRRDSRFSDLLIIAQTGWGQEPDRQRSAEARFDYHLVKPLNPDVLERLITGGRPTKSSVSS